MNIKRITMSASPLKHNFGAQTKINAPEELLNSDEIKYFEKIGAKIGKDNDIIEFSISDVHPSKRNPSTEVYTAEKKYLISHSNGVIAVKNKIDVPYIKDGEVVEKNSPFNYIKKAMEKLLAND